MGSKTAISPTPIADTEAFNRDEMDRSGCRRDLCWNGIWRNPRGNDITASYGELNALIGRLLDETPQAVHLAHPRIDALAQREHALIFFADAAHVRSDHHAGRTWGKVGETPVVTTGTGARFGFSLISAITSKGHMRFMITEAGVNAGVFIEFLKRLLIGVTQKIFLIVDRGPAHRAKKTKAFVGSLGGALRLFFLPPYSPDLNPDELVWNHLKTHTVGRTTADSKQSVRGKVLSSMRSLQNTSKKIAAFFQKPSLKYAA